MNQKWSKKYSVGNKKIDNHHKEIFQLVSMLDSAIYDKHSREEIAKIVDFLNHYVSTHFKEEEALMKSSHFQGLEFHEREHVILTLHVKQIDNYFSQNVSLTHTIFLIRRFIDRLINHIIEVDTLISELEEK